MSLFLRLTSGFRGRQVGTDRFGNVYFEAHRVQPIYGRKRRWAIYAHGGREPTVVPPEWHAWMHHITDAPLPEQKRHAWQQEHHPNLTGTPYSYRPLGHDYAGGKRQAAAADYEAWTPGS